LPGKQLLVETNGSQDIGVIPDDAVAVVDVKCPGSGEGDSFDLANLERFRPHDEVKFVLSGREDYEFAREFLDKQGLISRVRYVHFSPVAGVLDAGELGRWIVEDGLRVRLQVQLHRVVGLS
jgi:7-carboxy-7-deazaguanine synthase